MLVSFAQPIENLVKYLLPNSSNEAEPVAGPIIVDKSPPDNNGFSGPPTLLGSTEFFSLLNVRHSDPTSITLK